MILPDWADQETPITLSTLYDWCTDNGITVHAECRTLPKNLQGAYCQDRQAIYLARNLPQRYLLPTLAHETVHAFYEHDGHQPNLVERRIDEALAVRLVNPTDYAYWEQEYGWHTGGIASAMSQPRWLIEAYRRALTKHKI